MKRFIQITLLSLGVVALGAVGAMRFPAIAQNVNCFFTQGGSSFNAGSGCTINVDSGGGLVIDSGATYTVAVDSDFSVKQSIDLDDTTNGVVDVLDLSHSSSDNNATALDGVGISVELENATGTSLVEEWFSLDFLSTTITNGSEDGDVVLSAMLAGTVTEVCRLDSSDQSFTIGRDATDTNGIDSLRLLPLTTARGSLRFTAAVSAGDTITTITNASQAGAVTYTIPDAGASAEFVLLTTAQVVAGTLTRADLTQETNVGHRVNFGTLFENGGVNQLTGNVDAEDAGTHYIIETAGVWLLSGNSPNSDTQTDTSVFQFTLPASYDDAASVTLRINALYTTVGDTQTIDTVCYEAASDGTVGADLVTTTVITLTASATDHDFALTASGLVAGDMLSCEFVTVFQDSDGTVGEANVNSIQMLLDTKG